MEANRDIRKTILTQMKLPEETKQYLDQITSPIIQEWSYLCAVEEMDIKMLRRIGGLAENDVSNTASVFMQEKEAFLRERYENNRELGDQVLSLQNKVESMYQRATSVEGALDDTIKKAFHDKDDLFGKVIESKNDLIREKDRQIQSLNEQIQKYEEDKESKTKLLDERYQQLMERYKIRNEVESKDDAEYDSVPEYSSKLSNTMSESAIAPESKKESIASSRYPDRRYCPSTKRENLFSRLCSERKIRQFIRLYIDNELYSSSQKDYLIQCLEEGDTLSMIRKYASHALTIDQMNELRRIAQERR